MAAIESDNIIAIDTGRMRKGMRSLAHEIAVDISNPKNLDLWKPLPSSDAHRVTVTEVLGTLGSFSQLWCADEIDVVSRITHMCILVLHAVQSGQYRDTNMLGRAMQCQAAAESVRLRLDENHGHQQASRQ